MRKARLTALIATVICAAAIVVVFGTDLIRGGLDEDTVPAAAMHADDSAAIPQIVNTKLPTDPVQGMEGVAASEELALYVNKATAEIAVKNLVSGHMWYSNPPEREQDPLAVGVNKEKLSAQMTITYENHTLQSFTMNSYTDSVKLGQVEYEAIPNGIRVLYTFGKAEGALDTLPKLISKERYEELILAKAEETYGRYLTRGYRLTEDESAYERIDVALSGIVLERVKEAFEQAGYTAEELAIDNLENGGEEAEEARKVFRAAIEYIVDGAELIVRVPTGEIEYPEAYPITQLSFLDYFGAGGAEDDGYLFVPDGSGSLIYFNNGKVDSDAYFEPIYGQNEVKVQRTRSTYDQVSRLPVYGMRNNGQAFLAMIEQGDAVATVRADIGGKVHTYNYVYPQFELLAQDSIQVAASAKAGNVPISSNVLIPVYQPERMSTDFLVRYAFLSGEEADYTGMARYYQRHLVEQGALDKLEPERALPFFLELVGNIPKQKSFLGVPYEDMEPLTTFEQAQEIIRALKIEGVERLKLRYLGWFNRGVNHELPTKVKVDEELGGAKGLDTLRAYVEQEGFELYPDVSLLHVYHDTSNFKPSQDAARYLNKKPALIYPYNPATFQRDATMQQSPYYVLSNRLLPALVDRLIEEYSSYGLEGVSLRHLGDELNADFREGKVVDRAQAKRIVQQQLVEMAEHSLNLMVTGGNAYTFPYVKQIIDIPMSDSRYHITDESIPFYRIVLHGYADYAGQPLNLTERSDPRLALLKAMETGSNLYFTWSHAPSSEVKETAFNHLYSIHFEYWLDQAASMYRELNLALSDVRDQAIVDHQKIEDQVVQVTYEGGKRLIVNYNDHDVDVEGMTIKGRDYTVVGENS